MREAVRAAPEYNFALFSVAAITSQNGWPVYEKCCGKAKALKIADWRSRGRDSVGILDGTMALP